MPANIPNWYIGRTGQLYVAEETTYGTAPTLVATNALRHLSQKLSFDPRQLAKSPERHTHPSQLVLLTRRQKASFDVKAQLYPSGVLNTLPEADLVLKNAIGNAATNVTLSTTFSGSPTTTTGTVASATGLQKGMPIQISIAAGGNAGVYVRWLSQSYTNGSTSLVWEPALPGAPASGDACKGTVGYAPGTAIPKSLDVAHYPQVPAASTPAREMLGCVIDKLSLMFDGSLEPMIQFSGPAQGLAGSSPNFTPQAQPGGFTTVGAENAIPSGLTGYFQLGTTLYEIEKMQIDIVNAMDLHNTALGTSKPNAYFRKGKRMVTVKIDAKVSDDLTLWTPANAASSNGCMIQIGTSSGKMWAVYMPFLVITDQPEVGDNEETNNWSFSGQALGSLGNDEIYVAAA
jgi:hypothetical protein